MYAYVIYNLDFKNDKYAATIKPSGIPDEDITTVYFKEEDVLKIKNVLKKYQVYNWDGFRKYDKNVLDGNTFDFSVSFKDGTNIEANGYMMYPKNYREVKSELDDIFLNYINNSEIE